MDDSKLGTEDARGYWTPKKRISYGPTFVWPPQPRAFLKWFFGLPGYLLPWNVLYAVAALGIWAFLTPELERFAAPTLGLIALMLARNIGFALLVYGGWHLWFYRLRRQGTAFKYNRAWPADRSSVFTFNNQVHDNMFWTLASGVPIWTAYEVLLLWGYANGYAPMILPGEAPVAFVLLFFLVPFIHEVGFYFAHRLLHVPWLYRMAHKLHHRNVNPGPWSGLSMHPIEHVIYFSTILLFFVIPAHPVHMINLASRLGLAPAQGHTGFDKVVVDDKTTWDVSYYAHYLHHRYHEVNYADGMVPLDKWFGSFHDGSPEADAAMKARRRRMGQGA